MQRVLVTGGNKGIGLAICTKLLDDHPACHVLMGSRDLPRGQHAMETLVAAKPSRAGRVEVVHIDVSCKESVVKAAAEVASKYGTEPAPLFGLINNAGIAAGSLKDILEVNVHGVHRTCEAFLPLLDSSKGRIVNIASASGPNFVVKCTEERQKFFTNPDITWGQIEGVMKEALAVPEDAGEEAWAAIGMQKDPSWLPYGLSKACVNLITMMYTKQYANLVINGCSPGFIETDLTRPMAAAAGKKVEELGMKQPEDGAFAPVALMMDDGVKGRGWYYGSDALRSPLDRYRNPGDPAYEP